jgi:hypothetical protein
MASTFMLAKSVDSGKISSVMASIFLFTLCYKYFPTFTTKTIIEADVSASLMSIIAMCAISKVPSAIYIPYLKKNSPHRAKALKHPKATSVYMSIDPN